MNEHFLPPYFQFALEGCLKVLPSQRGQVCSSTALVPSLCLPGSRQEGDHGEGEAVYDSF